MSPFGASSILWGHGSVFISSQSISYRSCSPPFETSGPLRESVIARRRARGGSICRIYQHSEQRDGYRPPPPVEDDGYVVDVSPLQDLIDSGTLRVAKRPLDYADRRTDGYSEPLELYVLGTSHASETSAEHVRRVLATVRPQSVVVELCKSRAGLMMPISADANASSPLGFSGEGFAATLGRSVRIGGQSVALLRAALAWVVQESMLGDGERGGQLEEGRGARVPLYGDFRAAREAAEEAGAQIVLGDRPLEITLRRAWDALSVGERLDMVFTLLRLVFQRRRRGAFGGESGGGHFDSDTSAEGELRRKVSSGLVEDDTVEALMAMLATRFPSVLGPLIHERDLYMAWTLKRSRAVCGQRRIVGVVGRGHLAGVMRALASDRGGDTLIFKELAGSAAGERRQGGRRGGLTNGTAWVVGKLVVRIAAETAAGFALWDLFQRVTG